MVSRLIVVEMFVFGMMMIILIFILRVVLMLGCEMLFICWMRLKIGVGVYVDWLIVVMRLLGRIWVRLLVNFLLVM